MIANMISPRHSAISTAGTAGPIDLMSAPTTAKAAEAAITHRMARRRAGPGMVADIPRDPLCAAPLAATAGDAGGWFCSHGLSHNDHGAETTG